MYNFTPTLIVLCFKPCIETERGNGMTSIASQIAPILTCSILPFR
jgi:hypothetical protein